MLLICPYIYLAETVHVLWLPQLCITTWKLFETLLSKRHRHVVDNLVLRNLAGHAHVGLSLTNHDSATLCDADTETNRQIDYNHDVDRTVTRTADNVANFADVNSTSTLSASHTLSRETPDTLASGDSSLHSLHINSTISPSSQHLSDTIVEGSQNGSSAVSGRCSYYNEETSPSGETDKSFSLVDLCHHAVDGCQSLFNTETAASLMSCHSSSQKLTEFTGENSIQQLVYT